MRTYVSSFAMNTLCESYSKARVCFLSLLIITRNISLARARDRSSLAFQLKLPFSSPFPSRSALFNGRALSERQPEINEKFPLD